MSLQRDLFSGEPGIKPRELRRREHPGTSHEAAEHMVHTGKLGKMMAEALRLLRAYPGRTAAEIEHAAGVSDGRVRKRLNDLKKKGLASVSGARKCAVTKRNAQVWFPGENGDE